MPLITIGNKPIKADRPFTIHPFLVYLCTPSPCHMHTAVVGNHCRATRLRKLACLACVAMLLCKSLSLRLIQYMRVRQSCFVCTVKPMYNDIPRTTIVFTLTVKISIGSMEKGPPRNDGLRHSQYSYSDCICNTLNARLMLQLHSSANAIKTRMPQEQECKGSFSQKAPLVITLSTHMLRVSLCSLIGRPSSEEAQADFLGHQDCSH